MIEFITYSRSLGLIPTLQNWLDVRRQYHLRSHWHIPAAIEDVADVILGSRPITEWWPSFLAFEMYDAGNLNSTGRRFRVVTKGFLPYRLRFVATVTEVEYPTSFCVAVVGDFEGTARGTLIQEGPYAAVYFDWRIRVHKSLLRHWSFLLRPLFIMNHHWVVRCGQQRLRREFARRRLSLADPVA